jgi:hypothetical protein
MRVGRCAERVARSTYEGNGNAGRIWEDEFDFLKLASSSPVLGKEDPTDQLVRVMGVSKRKGCALPAGARVTKAVGDYDSRSVALYSRNDERSPSSHSEDVICSSLREYAAETVTRK